MLLFEAFLQDRRLGVVPSHVSRASIENAITYEEDQETGTGLHKPATTLSIRVWKLKVAILYELPPRHS